MKRVTLRSIAAEAEVSLATVDRVLNGRAGVSEEAEARVRQAMEVLRFKSRTIEPSAEVAREYRFEFIIPRGPKNTFMVDMRNYVEVLGRQLASQHVFLSVSDYAELSEQELIDALSAVNSKSCMGIAVVAIDSVPVREAIDALVHKGVGVVTLVSDVNLSRRFHSVGPNNVAAGRLAASLIGKFAGRRPGSVGLIGSMTLRDQADRRLGFEQVMARDYNDLQVLQVLEGRDDSTVTVDVLRELLRSHPDLIGLYNIGAGNRGIIQALEESGRKADINVVAHELTQHARRALISGIFDAVINQNFKIEVDYAIQALKAYVDSDVMALPGPVHLDVYFRDNLP
ncbi:MAG: LacI family DNA-binding transcriptional regulator [Ancalomicrobiaceae bacterium]|nr:LacI family DNA-binding transcriptional regulator [Ancalomicrobiaceae bacterium]